MCSKLLERCDQSGEIRTYHASGFPEPAPEMCHGEWNAGYCTGIIARINNSHIPIQQCNDDIKGIMPAEPSDAEIDKYTGQFERCAVKCIDKHVDLIPNMLKSIKSVLSKGPNKIPDV